MADVVAVRPWGNSQGIRIPKRILEKAGISVSDSLTITTEKNGIILKKQFKHKSFEERLDEYSGEIETVDFDWGEPKGSELF